jgi:hypothetical protein
VNLPRTSCQQACPEDNSPILVQLFEGEDAAVKATQLWLKHRFDVRLFLQLRSAFQNSTKSLPAQSEDQLYVFLGSAREPDIDAWMLSPMLGEWQVLLSPGDNPSDFLLQYTVSSGSFGTQAGLDHVVFGNYLVMREVWSAVAKRGSTDNSQSAQRMQAAKHKQRVAIAIVIACTLVTVLHSFLTYTCARAGKGDIANKEGQEAVAERGGAAAGNGNKRNTSLSQGVDIRFGVDVVKGVSILLVLFSHSSLTVVPLRMPGYQVSVHFYFACGFCHIATPNNAQLTISNPLRQARHCGHGILFFPFLVICSSHDTLEHPQLDSVRSLDFLLYHTAQYHHAMPYSI